MRQGRRKVKLKSIPEVTLQTTGDWFCQYPREAFRTFPRIVHLKNRSLECLFSLTEGCPPGGTEGTLTPCPSRLCLTHRLDKLCGSSAAKNVLGQTQKNRMDVTLRNTSNRWCFWICKKKNDPLQVLLKQEVSRVKACKDQRHMLLDTLRSYTWKPDVPGFSK